MTKNNHYARLSIIMYPITITWSFYQYIIRLYLPFRSKFGTKDQSDPNFASNVEIEQLMYAELPLPGVPMPLNLTVW